jgi:hypothetical protein
MRLTRQRSLTGTALTGTAGLLLGLAFGMAFWLGLFYLASFFL